MTETFKDRIRQAEEFREILWSARAQPLREQREALLKIRRDLGDLKTVQRSVLIELMSSFRDAEAFEELVELYNSFPGPLKDTLSPSSNLHWRLTVGINRMIASGR